MTTLTRREARKKYTLTKFTADIFITAVIATFTLSIYLGSGVIR
jgi:hypothetical protein